MRLIRFLRSTSDAPSSSYGAVQACQREDGTAQPFPEPGYREADLLPSNLSPSTLSGMQVAQFGQSQKTAKASRSMRDNVNNIYMIDNNISVPQFLGECEQQQWINLAQPKGTWEETRGHQKANHANVIGATFSSA